MRFPAACLPAVLLALLLLAPPPAAAHEPGEAAAFADRFLRQQPMATPVRRSSEPASTATPRAACDEASRPEPGLQGRVARADVDSGAARDGYTCNLQVVGRTGSTGGFKVLRYVDRSGRECAYYDTTLLFPTNTLNPSLEPTGVAVLDMSDASKPVRTATLVTPAMQTPHESLNLSVERGLLAAVMGNPAFAPGVVDVYDLRGDCRHPVLKSSAPVGLFGHESGMAPDGRTFYATSIGNDTTTAVDLTRPEQPKPLWVGRYDSHGMTVSDDGTRGYLATRRGLLILDLTEVQQRKPGPQVREVSRLAWSTMTIPQVAHPMTIDGRQYLVEVDEYSANESGRVTAHGPRVGAGRIIDISDERRPEVVSDIRLEVHQPEHRDAIAQDYGARNPTQGYAAHYCGVPTRVDPRIVACSMINSGLRVFDIRDPQRPKEIAYFVAPPSTISATGGPVIDERANWAMSQPAFVPERGEIWYSDGTSGFYALKLRSDVWPPRKGSPGAGAADGPGTDPVPPSACPQRHVLRLPSFKGRRVVRAVAIRGGKRIAARRGGRLRVLRLRRESQAYRVRLRLRVQRPGRPATARTVTVTRRVPACRS